MAKQGISTGTTPNDGSGDSLLAGAIKINSNFDELYSAIGDGSSLSTPVTSITAGDNITVTASTGNITISGIGTGDIDTDRINVSGVVTANSFSGSGVNLTNLPAAALTGALPALDGSALTGVVASGVGVTVQDGGSGKGSASILNFGANLSVTTTNSGITTISAGAANTANLNSDTIVVGVLTATTFAGDLTLSNGDLNLPSTGGINATTSTENLQWGQGNFYFNSGSPEIGWVAGSGSVAVGAGNAIDGYKFEIEGKNTREKMGVFTVGGSAELYYDNSKKFETTGTGVTITGGLSASGVSTFASDIKLGPSANIVTGGTDTLAINAPSNYVSLNSYGIFYNSGNVILNNGGQGTTQIKNQVYVLSGITSIKNDVSVQNDVDLGRNLSVTGVSTFSGDINIEDLQSAYFGTHNDLRIWHQGGYSMIDASTGTGSLYIQGKDIDNSVVIRAFNDDALVANFNGSVDLYHNNSKKFSTTGVGVTITGNVYATGISTFIGNVIIGRTANEGSGMLLNGNGDNGGEINFTGPDSTDSNSTYYANIRLNRSFSNFKGDLEFHTNGYTGVGGGVGDFIFYKRETSSGRAERMRLEGESGDLTITGSFNGDGSNLVDGKWTLGANGTSDYTFTGIGFTQTTNDPILYLARGRVYEFVNTMNAHPFEIRESAGGSAFDRGVTNNGTQNGTVRFEIPFDAPNTLYYQCTSHSGMGSTIVVYPNTI